MCVCVCFVVVFGGEGPAGVGVGGGSVGWGGGGGGADAETPLSFQLGDIPLDGQLLGRTRFSSRGSTSHHVRGLDHLLLMSAL